MDLVSRAEKKYCIAAICSMIKMKLYVHCLHVFTVVKYRVYSVPFMRGFGVSAVKQFYEYR